MNFNKNQLQAIESESKRIMCLAGAGSGKTATLTEKIHRLNIDHEIDFENILCLTFTRMSGIEMKERIVKKNKDAKNLFANTFHSFGCEMIEEYGELLGYDSDFTIYDAEDEKDLISAVIFDLSLKVSVKKYYEFLSGEVDEKKDNKIFRACEMLKKEFYNKLSEYNAIHFDGILEVMHELLQNRKVQKHYHEKYKYVFVDEAQDNNQLQTDIVDLINPEYLFIVGDINQSIYGWRGAKPENFAKFPETHDDVEVITLTDNYRSTSQIVAAANQLIKKKDFNYDVNMIAHKEGEEPEIKRYATYKDELRYIMFDILDQHEKLSDACVLTRTNPTARDFANMCEDSDIEYNLVSNSTDPLKSNDIQDLFTILKVACNQRDNFTTRKLLRSLLVSIPAVTLKEYELESTRTGQSLYSVIFKNSDEVVKAKIDLIKELDASNVSDIRKTFNDLVTRLNLEAIYVNQTRFTKLGILKEVKDIIKRWCNKRLGMGYRIDVGAFLKWLMLRDIREKLKEAKDGINIMTMHTSKGLEFKHVYIINCNEGVIPHKRGEAIEELNLMYVATTRAEEQLTISHCVEKVVQFNKAMSPTTHKLKPSRYIKDIVNLSLF